MQKDDHTILIVDDEPISRQLLTKLLESDHRIFTAGSGPEGVEILKREDISLLITDQNMPGMTGIELVRVSRSINPKIICMLMSAVDDGKALADAIAGFGDVRMVTKPWNSSKLMQDVKCCFETLNNP